EMESWKRARFLRYFRKEAGRMMRRRVAEAECNVWARTSRTAPPQAPRAGRLPDGPVQRKAVRMRFFKECAAFFGEFRRQFRTTGAILPSSRFLARALVYQLRQPRPAARILEVGPGTGSVTRAIARHMLPDDRLDAVEINERFVNHLERAVDG